MREPLALSRQPLSQVIQPLAEFAEAVLHARLHAPRPAPCQVNQPCNQPPPAVPSRGSRGTWTPARGRPTAAPLGGLPSMARSSAGGQLRLGHGTSFATHGAGDGELCLPPDARGRLARSVRPAHRLGRSEGCPMEAGLVPVPRDQHAPTPIPDTSSDVPIPCTSAIAAWPDSRPPPLSRQRCVEPGILGTSPAAAPAKSSAAVPATSGPRAWRTVVGSVSGGAAGSKKCQ